MTIAFSLLSVIKYLRDFISFIFVLLYILLLLCPYVVIQETRATIYLWDNIYDVFYTTYSIFHISQSFSFVKINNITELFVITISVSYENISLKTYLSRRRRQYNRFLCSCKLVHYPLTCTFLHSDNNRGVCKYLLYLSVLPEKSNNA